MIFIAMMPLNGSYDPLHCWPAWSKMSAQEASGELEMGRREGEPLDLHEQLLRVLRVAARGFAVGAGLHIGASVLAGIANKKLMKSPLPVLRAVVTGDTVRFGSFCGLSVAVYKTALSVLQRRAQHLRRYHSLIAGLLAGAVSAIDKPGRRQTLSLFMTARALGVLVIILNRRGLLPTIPHFVTILFSLCQSLIIVTVTKYPSFLTPSYYRALLRWSQYYTDEKLQVYFRQPHPVPCNALLHRGSCHATAFRDFYTGLWLFFKIYVTLYSLPTVIFRSGQLVSCPGKTVWTLLSNSVRSALFFAVDASMVKYALCLLRNAWPYAHPVPVFIPFLAGMSGVLGLLIERQSRRVELMYYVLPQVLYLLTQLLQRGPLPVGKLPLGSVLTFSFSLALILHACHREKTVLSPLISRAVNFLFDDP